MTEKFKRLELVANIALMLVAVVSSIAVVAGYTTTEFSVLFPTDISIML